jgi:hypothetical protein
MKEEALDHTPWRTRLEQSMGLSQDRLRDEKLRNTYTLEQVVRTVTVIITGL